MPQLPQECISCLNPLVLKQGQCENCGEPPLMVLDENDVLPLQFLNWAHVYNLSRLVGAAKIGEVHIDFVPQPLPEFEKRCYELNDSVDAYRELVDEIENPETNKAATMGLAAPDPTDNSEPLKKLEWLRQSIFQPVEAAIARSIARLTPIDVEFEMLGEPLILRKRLPALLAIRKRFEAFALITNRSRRQQFDAHMDVVHPLLLSETTAVAKLNGLMKSAYIPNLRGLAMVKLFLQFGECEDVLIGYLEGMKLAKSTAVETGFVLNFADSYFIETVAQFLTWASFRPVQMNGRRQTARSQLDLRIICNSLVPLKGLDADLDPWIDLLRFELGLLTELPPELASAAKADPELQMLLNLISKPFDKGRIQSLLDADPRFASLHWLVGKQEFLSLPLIHSKIAEEDFKAVERSARALLHQMAADPTAQVADQTMDGIRRNVLIAYRNLPDWDKGPLPSSLKDALLNIFLRFASHHGEVVEAVNLLSAPPETFWRRTSVRFDADLARAIVNPRGWNYRPDTFLSSLKSVAELQANQTLYVEPEFLAIILDDYLKPAPELVGFRDVDTLPTLFQFLSRTAKAHGNVQVLANCFAHLFHFNAGPKRVNGGQVIDLLVSLSTERQKLIPAQPELLNAAQKSVDFWRTGFERIFEAALSGPDKYYKPFALMVEQEGLVRRYDESIPKAEKQKWIDSILRYRDPGTITLFSLLGAAVSVVSESDRNAAVPRDAIEALSKALRDSLALEKTKYRDLVASLTAKFKTDCTSAKPTELAGLAIAFQQSIKACEKEMTDSSKKLQDDFNQTANLLRQSAG